jgi:1-phosphatidylinositol-4-phosphate 5-kinase
VVEGEEGHDEFDGEWVNGKMHGWGTLQWASGDRYDGNWSAGEISGNGIMTWNDGSSFSGQWKSGKKDGSGAFMISGIKDDSVPRNTRKVSVQIKRSARLKTSFDESEGEEMVTADLGNTYLLLCECSEDEILKKEVVEADRVAHKYSSWKSPMASRSRKVRKVRHGETIYKGHGSYDLMLQLRVGIRWSVSSIQEFTDVSLETRSFDVSLKQQFPRDGSAKTPPHFARTFKWKEYRPEVFRKLRARWRVNPAQFMLSLCGDQALRELSSPGKSGSVFYISHDDQFIIKTMRKSEMVRLKSWLHVYYQHVHDYPETLLPKFYGLYSVKAAGSATKVRVVVMSNLFSAKHPIHKTFDLKGSTHGRFTKPEVVAPHTVLKDLDISTIFRVEEGKRDKLIEQLKNDCMFLQKLRIMDYSLLVGVHVLPPALGRGRPASPLHEEVGITSPVQEESGSPWGGAQWRDDAIQSVRRNMKALDLYNDRKKFGFAHGMEEVSASELATMRPPPGTDDLIAYSNGAAKSELGVAMAAVSVHGRVLTNDPPVESPIDDQTEPQDVILYLGIIDILQEYTTSKNLETKMMGVMGKTSFSSVDPTSYAKRFLKFLSDLFE